MAPLLSPPPNADPLQQETLPPGITLLHPPSENTSATPIETSPAVSRPTTPASFQSTAPSSVSSSPSDSERDSKAQAPLVVLDSSPSPGNPNAGAPVQIRITQPASDDSNSDLNGDSYSDSGSDASSDSDASDSASIPPERVPLPPSRAVSPGPELPPAQNPFQIVPSSAAREWETRKREFGEVNDAIDELMGYVGLEEVKQQFLDIKSQVDICNDQGRDLKKARFNIVFQGNPGTGKTTIARLYAKFLHSVGVIRGEDFEESSGIKLCAKGAYGVNQMLGSMLSDGGGVLFIDEAYQLTAPYTDGLGRQALDVILTTMENEVGKLAVVFVGYRDEMESFYEHNPGLTSRIPYVMSFADFTDAELWQILHDNIRKQYNGRMKVEGGMDGLYMRIVVCRLARSRKNRGFGNARAVENLLEAISKRQSGRIKGEKLKGNSPDPLLLTKEDLIGPEPDLAVAKSRAWADLQKLIGLNSVKESVQSLLRMTQYNYRRELEELRPFQFSLNQLFVGEPGTGKTTVAKLYGRILADIGLLSRGDVVLKTPADFIGECLGKSEAKTKKILEATVGKVLVIDEAYMLDAGDASKDQDKFKTGVIDTLVAMVQGVPGEDRCIILVGYEDKITTMFENVNPGLSRRFPIRRPFRFHNFDLPQLIQILEKKMLEQDIEATPEAMEAARDVLERALMRPNFPNAGEIDSLLDAAKKSFETRQASKPVCDRLFHSKLEPEDFDKDFARGTTRLASSSCEELTGLVHPKIIEKLKSYSDRCIGARRHGLRPRDQVPTNFVFKGLKGTGKTITAQHMGKIFYDMGFLATADVIECGATDLIGQYVGQTCPKTQKMLKKGLGKVLFIDEAYRLIFGEFAAQAVDEIVQFLSDPAHMGKMVVIFAGYTADINFLMTRYPAISGLFTEEIVFENLTPDECIGLLLRELGHSGIVTQGDFLLDPQDKKYLWTARLFKALQVIPGWGNARDVKLLAKQILGKFLESSMSGPERQGVRAVTADQVLATLLELVTQRRNRSLDLSQNGNSTLPALPPVGSGVAPPQLATAPAPPPVGSSVDIATATSTQTQLPSSSTSRLQSDGGVRERNADSDDDTHSARNSSPSSPASRDAGVTDAEWAELEEEKKSQTARLKQADNLQRELDAKQTALAQATADGGQGGNCDGLSGHCDLLSNELSKLQKMMQKEQKVQKKLMDRCDNGYMWYHVAGGWRCEGGMHYVADQDIMGEV
ncbi:cbxX protein [Cladorrhinum sp. PSN259]|nr:cbxX protein [Cladorrhinum sp. PSN259]